MRGSHRADLASRNIKAVIPGRSNRRVEIERDRVLVRSATARCWLKIVHAA
jgi:hypothetical protein